MKIINYKKGSFLSCETTTIKKVILNICDCHAYGLTDTNYFYRNWYADPEKDYKANRHLLGDIVYSKVLSYHIIANMICVELPKTTFNIQPFKINHFKKCCNNLLSYIENNEIKEVHTPVFGTKILEGDWEEILHILKGVLEKSNTIERLIIYG